MIPLTKSTYFLLPVDADLKANYVLRPVALPAKPVKDLIVWPKPGPKGKYVKTRGLRYFPKLPNEVRCMIFKFALANLPARKIVVKYSTSYDEKLDHGRRDLQSHSSFLKPNVTADVPPRLLGVEWAASSAIHKEYKLVFGEVIEEPVYFNPHRDHIHFNDTNAINILLGQRHNHYETVVPEGGDQGAYCDKCPPVNTKAAKVLFEQVRSISIDRLRSSALLCRMNAVEKVIILKHDTNIYQLADMWEGFDKAVARGDTLRTSTSRHATARAFRDVISIISG